MKLQELMEMLNMENPADFQYFEQLADLLEYDDEIPYDLFYTVLSEVESETMGELIENYMDELSDNLPEHTTDLFTLVETIKQRLLLLAQDLEIPETRRTFTEELFRFRLWYTRPDAVLVDGAACSLLEAITLQRAEKLGENKHQYDLEDCIDYELEEITMNLGEFSPIDIVENSEE